MVHKSIITDWLVIGISFKLNVFKCQIMSFTQIINCIKFDYTINGSTNPIAGKSDWDLGFHPSRILYPRLHIKEIYCEALKLLAISQRISLDFKL